VCSLEEDHGEKRCEIHVGSQEMAVTVKILIVMVKILIVTIQVNLVPNPSEMWRRQHKFT